MSHGTDTQQHGPIVQQRLEVRQLRRINPIGFDLFAAGGGDTRRGHHITMIPLVGSIPWQRITKIGRFITYPDGASRKMSAQVLKLAEQALQPRPTLEIKAGTGGLVKG